MDIQSTYVGLIGFSGPWPTSNAFMTAVFKTGTISLLTEFARSRDRSKGWTFVGFTAPGGEGDSGSPVFSSDGRVIAVCAWSRLTPRRVLGVQLDELTSAAIHVDALWELLEFHNLAKLIPMRPSPSHRHALPTH